MKKPGGHGTGILCSTGARVLASSMVVLHAIERAAETHAHVGHGVSLHVAAKDRVEKRGQEHGGDPQRLREAVPSSNNPGDEPHEEHPARLVLAEVRARAR